MCTEHEVKVITRTYVRPASSSVQTLRQQQQLISFLYLLESRIVHTDREASRNVLYSLIRIKQKLMDIWNRRT
jgi:hypothetical protein